MNLKSLIVQKPAKYDRLANIVGASYDIYTRVAFLMSIATTLMTVGIFYNTVVGVTPWLQWLTFPLFVVMAFTGLILSSWLIWIHLIPRLMAYGNHLLYKHDSPIRRDIERLEEKIDRLLKKENSDDGQDR